MLLEAAVLVLTVLLTYRLLRRPLRRVPLPAWLVRARRRGRPGVPVTAWLAALMGMLVLWWIGERRGLMGTALLLLWIGLPMTALRVTLLWRQKPD